MVEAYNRMDAKVRRSWSSGNKYQRAVTNDPSGADKGVELNEQKSEGLGTPISVSLIAEAVLQTLTRLRVRKQNWRAQPFHAPVRLV